MMFMNALYISFAYISSRNVVQLLIFHTDVEENFEWRGYLEKSTQNWLHVNKVENSVDINIKFYNRHNGTD